MISIFTTTTQMLQELANNSNLKQAQSLVDLKYWSDLGVSDRAIWGTFKNGSQNFKVIVNADQNYYCDCPTRKRPCKHGLALLLLTNTPDVFAVVAKGDEPDFVKQNFKTKLFAPSPSTDQIVPFDSEIFPMLQKIVDCLSVHLPLEYSHDFDFYKLTEELEEILEEFKQVEAPNIAFHVQELIDTLNAAEISTYDEFLDSDKGDVQLQNNLFVTFGRVLFAALEFAGMLHLCLNNQEFVKPPAFDMFSVIGFDPNKASLSDQCIEDEWLILDWNYLPNDCDIHSFALLGSSSGAVVCCFDQASDDLMNEFDLTSICTFKGQVQLYSGVNGPISKFGQIVKIEEEEGSINDFERITHDKGTTNLFYVPFSFEQEATAKPSFVFNNFKEAHDGIATYLKEYPFGPNFEFVVKNVNFAIVNTYERADAANNTVLTDSEWDCLYFQHTYEEMMSYTDAVTHGKPFDAILRVNECGFELVGAIFEGTAYIKHKLFDDEYELAKSVINVAAFSDFLQIIAMRISEPDSFTQLHQYFMKKGSEDSRLFNQSYLDRVYREAKHMRSQYAKHGLKSLESQAEKLKLNFLQSSFCLLSSLKGGVDETLYPNILKADALD